MNALLSLDLKKVIKSRTIWLNFVVATLLLAEANITGLQGLLPDGTYKIVAFALPMLNLWLRMGTTRGLLKDAVGVASNDDNASPKSAA